MFDTFDLQLFTDEGEGPGATEMDSGGANLVEKVGLDENRDVKIFYEEPETVALGDEYGTPSEKGEQAYYSPEEVRSSDFEKLDPARIPSELLPWYKSMQAGFTRKTQELAQQKKAVQDILEQAKGSTPPPTLENPQRVYVEQMTHAARGQVEQYFGQEFDEFNPSHQAAMTLAVQQMYSDVAQAAGKQENLLSLETDLRTKDANYDAIYEYAKSKVAELPYRDYVKLQKAFTDADVGMLQRFYDVARKSFYAERQGVRTGEQRSSAPRLEGAGRGVTPEKGSPDFAELGKIKSFDEKLTWLRKHNIKP